MMDDSVEGLNVNESYHSSMSVSSSITVISPENHLADSNWRSDTKSDAKEETSNHHGTQSKEEVSKMLSGTGIFLRILKIFKNVKIRKIKYSRSDERFVQD